MDPVTRRFGHRVRDLRLARGWTQEELGIAAGLDPKHIGVIERGQKSSSFGAVARLASALKVDIHQLFVPIEGEKFAQRGETPVTQIPNFQNLSRAKTAKFLDELHAKLQRLGGL